MSNLGLGIILSGKDVDAQNAMLKTIGDYLGANSAKSSVDDKRRPTEKPDEVIDCYYAINGDVSDKLEMMLVYQGVDSPSTLWFDKPYEIAYLEKRLIQFMKDHGVQKQIIIYPDTKVNSDFLNKLFDKFQPPTTDVSASTKA